MDLSLGCSLGQSSGNRLPPGAIFRTGTDGVDVIGLSIADYLLVPAELRSIFYINSTTMRSAADILWRIKTSPYPNISKLVGKSQKVFVLYPDDTAVATLQKACRYCGTVYGTYLGADFDGNTITGTPDIGAFEYQG